jgi:hypothetical protein
LLCSIYFENIGTFIGDVSPPHLMQMRRFLRPWRVRVLGCRYLEACAIGRILDSGWSWATDSMYFW